MPDEELYLLSLGAGLLVGVVYSLLDVRSPAPPVIALVGLLGILVGEQILPVGRQMLAGTSMPHRMAARCSVAHHVFGAMPGRQDGAARPTAAPTPGGTVMNDQAPPTSSCTTA